MIEHTILQDTLNCNLPISVEHQNDIIFILIFLMYYQ